MNSHRRSPQGTEKTLIPSVPCGDLRWPTVFIYEECGVISAESKQAIESLCPEVGKEVIQDFFARMDEDYFATFSPEEISTHIKMSCALDRERPAECRVTQRGPDEFDIVIVGYDYLSEFSIFCGLLSAFGLDIRAGNIYSFARSQPGEARPRLTRRETRGKAQASSQRQIEEVSNV